MNLGTQKWKKARANFAEVRDDAGRCGTACTRARPRPREPPWACSSQGQGQGMLRACCQGQGHGIPHGQAVKAKAHSQGHGMLAWARWHAPGRRQQGPWGHAARALASGSTARAWHAPWVGCQGRGMPLGPLEGCGSTWEGVLQPSPDSLFGHLLLFPP